MAYADSVLPADGRWLLCDGSYVSTVSYPRLSAVIGSKFGSLSTSGGTQYFKLPDLRGKVVMGFTNTLAYDLSGTGMTFAFASSGGEYKHTLLLNEIPAHAHTFLLYGDSSNGTNVQGGSSSYNTGSKTTDSSGGGQPHTNIQPYLALSYIIKAIPDTIATCNIVLESNLSASEVLRGVVSSINPLSGSYTLGLASIIAPTNAGYLSTNQKGQVTSFDATSAGVVNNQGANNTPVTHVYGFVNYLYTPVPAASITLFGTVSSTWSQRVNVYPTLSSSLFGNLATPVVNLPNKAKNVIVEVTAVSTSFSPQYVYSALHRDNLGTGSTRNTREYTLNSGYGGTTQVTIPLSANQNDGTISFAIRGWAPSNNFYQRFEINIIGWTQ
jgi:microcystin-dependent protein